MLNRTNRTLSANQNRLNLGTRSNALVVGVVVGEQTLRTLPASSFPRISMRAEDADIRGYLMFMGYPVTAFSGLPSAWSSTRSGGELVAEAPPVSEEVVQDGQPCRARQWQGHAHPRLHHEALGLRRKPSKGHWSSDRGPVGKGRSAQTISRLAATAAAAAAAAG
jgi:hypothetical protein